MAKKKAAIGDLIKSDMSRRIIGEEVEMAAETVMPAETPPEVMVPPSGDSVPALPVTGGTASLDCFIAALAQSAGITGESDLRNLHGFLQDQAMRYIRGFNAGRRFHG